MEGLDLETVLRRIVEAGMSLVGAQYGALGVISPDGTLERFIHIGIDERMVGQIGHLPEGHGVLGAVITDHEPILLDHIADDPRSVGFPDHHPAMDSFLGVPVRVGDEVYGNLYLTNSADGSFTTDDRELVTALAATAGIAIENARLYDTARTRELWNATIADVMAAMLDVSGENVLDVIAERVAALIAAELVAVVVPHRDGEFAVTASYGIDAAALQGQVYPASGSLAERALASRKAVSIGAQPTAALWDWEPSLGPTVAIPLFIGVEPMGVLTVSRAHHGTAFTPADLDMAFSFAAQASIALEIVRARDDRKRIDTARDRSRIARDLHDHVIQRLFGAGLALQGASATADDETARAIEAQIDTLDAAIKDIRTAIFALSSNERSGAKRFRDQILDVVAEVTHAWTTPPRIEFSGALDSLVSTEMAADVLAVLRELLTNIVKHAQASTAQVSVAIDDHRLRLTVEDDGIGIADVTRRSGLANIDRRATIRGGGVGIRSSPGGGTRVEWTALLSEGGENS